jgi:hypothetical protein
MPSAAYMFELMEYVDGRSPWPPCEECADPIEDGGITGATLCEDCCLLTSDPLRGNPETRSNKPISGYQVQGEGFEPSKASVCEGGNAVSWDDGGGA